jgi:dTDP-4-dehydrorhamnose 3,5-epimerase
MPFDVVNTEKNGVLEFYPIVYEDDRGLFLETYSERDLEKAFKVEGLPSPKFVQENESISLKKNTIRGMHLQLGEHRQGKLVKVIKGRVLDVIVDLREGSETFGNKYSFVLTDVMKKMLYIPPGFAHGFKTLEDNTIFSYKCTNYYNKESECCIKYDSIGIDWGLDGEVANISDKDAEGIDLAEFIKIHKYG